MTKGDYHEMLKLEIIRILPKDGFKIINTVFDQTRAEKHMMCKELQQPTTNTAEVTQIKPLETKHLVSYEQKKATLIIYS